MLTYNIYIYIYSHPGEDYMNSSNNSRKNEHIMTFHILQDDDILCTYLRNPMFLPDGK